MLGRLFSQQRSPSMHSMASKMSDASSGVTEKIGGKEDTLGAAPKLEDAEKLRDLVQPPKSTGTTGLVAPSTSSRSGVTHLAHYASTMLQAPGAALMNLGRASAVVAEKSAAVTAKQKRWAQLVDPPHRCSKILCPNPIDNFALDPKSGEAHILYLNGSTYKGNVKQSVPHGQGILVLAQGVQYDGDFRDGTACGHGTYRDEINGIIYRGQFEAGVFQGQGSYNRRANNRQFEGSFKDGMFDGQGTLKVTRHDGITQTYVGGFSQDTYHGYGVMTTSHDHEYTGHYVNGKYQGTGFYRGRDNQTYAGEWFNDAPHGKGIMVLPQGGSQKGIFKAGKFITPLPV